MRKLILCISLLFFAHYFANAQTTTELDTVQVSTNQYALDDDFETSTNYTEKKFREANQDTTIEFNDFELNNDSINNWKNAAKYKWVKTLEKDLKNSIEENQKEEERSQRSSKGNRDYVKQDSGVSSAQGFFDSQLLKIIMWSLAGLFIGFVIYNLFLSKGVFSKNTKYNSTAAVEEVVDENNMGNDFETLKRKAYNAGDTRLAMRYLFLKMLQKLDQRSHIKFGTDKTNAVYAREMQPTFRNDFSSLALYFEYVWYGKFEIAKDVFDKIESQYNQFLNRI